MQGGRELVKVSLVKRCLGATNVRRTCVLTPSYWIGHVERAGLGWNGRVKDEELGLRKGQGDKAAIGWQLTITPEVGWHGSKSDLAR